MQRFAESIKEYGSSFASGGELRRYLNLKTLVAAFALGFVAAFGISQLKKSTQRSFDVAEAKTIQPVPTKSYRVKYGDSLRSIAKNHLGSETYWKSIQKLNKLSDHRIRVGQELILPARAR